MNRRGAVKRVTFLLGGFITAGSLSVLTEGCNFGENGDVTFTDEHLATITDIADTIIPDTNIPGAKVAGVGPFIIMMMKDCYAKEVQKIFIDGLEKTGELSESLFNKSFKALSQTERGSVLEALRTEAKALNEKNLSEGKNDAPPHFFRLATELTYLGYFTSEIGATQALNYVHIPGKYEGCIPLKAGQKAWAV